MLSSCSDGMQDPSKGAVIQTTVVGNYPRIGGKGRGLRAAMHRHDRGESTREELESVADEVTREVLREQAKAG